MMRTAIALLAAVLVTIPASSSHAQSAAQAGTLVVTVVDTTGAVLPGATVKVAGIEAADKSVPIAPVIATADGTATIQKLAPGRYSVQAEFSGFETRILPDVRVRGGNNKQVLMLPIEGHKESVLVARTNRRRPRIHVATRSARS